MRNVKFGVKLPGLQRAPELALYSVFNKTRHNIKRNMKKETIFVYIFLHGSHFLSKFKPSEYHVLQVPKMTTIMSYNSAKPVLGVVPYFLHLHLYTLIAEVILLYNWVKLEQEKCLVDLFLLIPIRKSQQESNLASELTRVLDVLFQPKNLVIFLPITVALLNCSKPGIVLLENGIERELDNIKRKKLFNKLM